MVQRIFRDDDRNDLEASTESQTVVIKATTWAFDQEEYVV